MIGHPFKGSFAGTQEDAEGQALRHGGLAQTEEYVEGQIYILQRPKPDEDLDDAQGHGVRFNGIQIEEEVVEGQGARSSWLLPVSADDVATRASGGWLASHRTGAGGPGTASVGPRARRRHDGAGVPKQRVRHHGVCAGGLQAALLRRSLGDLIPL